MDFLEQMTKYASPEVQTKARGFDILLKKGDVDFKTAVKIVTRLVCDGPTLEEVLTK